MKSKNKRNAVMRLGYFQDDKCFFCDGPLHYLDPHQRYDHHSEPNADQDVLAASRDHYIKHDDGGNGSAANTVISHRVCNTKEGQARFTPELDEKFRLLNLRRGFGDANGVISVKEIVKILRPEQFSQPSPALEFLCDMANALEGEEGIRIRRSITARLQDHNKLIKKLSGLETNLMYEALVAIKASRSTKYQLHLPERFSTLLDNVLSTMTKRAVGRLF